MGHAAAAYETLDEYYVSCEGMVLVPNEEKELTLKVTNPGKMRGAFQVDVTLSPELQLIAYESQQYCQATGICSIVSSYSPASNMLRILATKSENWAVGEGVEFARIKVRANSSDCHNATITLKDMVFMGIDNDTGRSGSATTVTFNIISDEDVTQDGNVDIADVNAVLIVMMGRASNISQEDADVNSDGVVDIFDVNQIICVMLGNGTVPEPVPVTHKIYTVNGVSFTMVAVEGGTFTMGATPEQGSDAYSDEIPAHQVTLSSYSIGQTEVTQELWQAVMGSNPSYCTGDLQRPVECVSWDDCQTFISKLNQMTGLNFRLPTEAEWEYAARGGNRSQGYKYAGSNNVNDVAWYYDNSYALGSSNPEYGTHNAATKAPNELGLYDMSGNVCEWCQDWFGGYSSGAQTSPTGPASGSYRVFRGGGWGNFAGRCRVSHRSINTPSGADGSLGLRLAL